MEKTPDHRNCLACAFPFWAQLTADEQEMLCRYTRPVHYIVPYGDRWLLTEPSCDTVYTYSPADGLKPFIVRTPSIQSMSPEIFLFPGVVTDRYCFMQTVKKELNLAMMDTYYRLMRTDLVYDRVNSNSLLVLWF